MIAVLIPVALFAVVVVWRVAAEYRAPVRRPDPPTHVRRVARGPAPYDWSRDGS